jgi:hypothetical protein
MNTIKLEELYTTTPGTTGEVINNITTRNYCLTTLTNAENTTINSEINNFGKIENKKKYTKIEK